MLEFNKPIDYVEIDGIKHKINTDFRIWIEISDIMSDKGISDRERLTKSLLLCYGTIPNKPAEALERMLWFFRGGNEIKPKKNQEKNQKAVYSFKYDADYIYAAFLQQYGIDITDASLHWWRFKA